MNSKPVLVFIEGPAPTEEDLALFDSAKADQFVNSSLHGTGVIAHSRAVAVDPAWIPKGYATEVPEVEAKAPAPVQNPSAPPQAPKDGALGIQAGDGPSLGPDGKPVALAKPNFGQQSKG